MLAIIIVFALLAGYGQWKRSQRSKVITATIVAAPNESSTPSTQPPRQPPSTPGRIVAPGVNKARMEPVGTPAPEPQSPRQ
jgi:hypothetical protein